MAHVMKLNSGSLIAGMALASWLVAVAAPDAASPAEPKDTPSPALQKEQETLGAENKLQAERLTKETNAMRAEIGNRACKFRKAEK